MMGQKPTVEKQKKAAALRYNQGVDVAPKLVAKGRGAVAEKMIAIATAHHVPIHEDKNMVEILSTLDLYQNIPIKLYRAVAEVLGFLYKAGKKL